LVDHENLSIKLEELPPGGRSDLHFHNKARQFFFLIRGQALVEVDEEMTPLGTEQGVEVPPGRRHQIVNPGDDKTVFVLVSSPRVRENDIFVV
jgi:mannose-6-phosphate isomerase-like protein (cupin superfamily)